MMSRWMLPSAALFVTLPQQALGLQRHHHEAESSPHPADFESSIWPCAGIECVKKYVELPDEHYQWKDTGNRLSGVDPSSGVSWTGYVLNMTSQKWLTRKQVDYPIQWHTMVVVVPENLELSDWANLMVDFGINHNPHETVTEVALNRYSNDHGETIHSRHIDGEAQGSWVFSHHTSQEALDELKEASFTAAYLATHTQTVSISLFCALNAVQGFKDDSLHMARTEDHIKAYSWIEFMEAGGDEPERIMELPVAKAVVRAMDTATAFTGKLLPSGKVTRFGVTGFSKLGMATWMAGAIDKRVKAIAPMAQPPLSWHTMSLLSRHVSRSPADPSVKDPYFGMGSVEASHPKEAARLHQIIDLGPWIDEVKVPVLYSHDTNDQWFSNQLGAVGSWMPLLPGPARVNFVNATHDGVALAALSANAAFFRGQILGEEMPDISYEVDSTGHMLTVKQVTAHNPSSVRLSYANSCEGSISQPVFLKSTWSETPEDLPELQPAQSLDGLHGASLTANTRTWVADLGALVQPSPGCSQGAFVRLEYPGPKPGYDAYQISMPAIVLPKLN